MAGIFGYVPNNTLGALYLTPQTGNEAVWRRALANQGGISKTRPSLGGRLENLTVDTLRKAGVSDRTAARLGSKTFSAVNDLTPVGNLTGADEGAAQFGRGLTRGDLGQAALGAGIFGLSVFPGAAGRVVGKVGKGMFGRLLKDESGAIRAWHGSPHDFDKFSLSKIGTGEGAQAYGHGLYFAENPAVAQAYQNNLAGIEFGSGNENLDRMLSETFKDLTATRMGPVTARDAADLVGERLSRQRDDALRAGDFDWFDQISDQRNALRQLMRDPPRPKGRLYEVNINADPQDFLDWDAPLSGQQEQVRNALLTAAQDVQPKGVLASAVNHQLRTGDLSVPGEVAYTGLNGMWDKARVDASNALLQRGIPGIRYLDQGSRSAADGTRNYVVFDDSLIDILNKF